MISFSVSLAGASGKSGIEYPLACNSAIAAFNCGTEALILGSFIMLASGVFAKAPNSVKASETF